MGSSGVLHAFLITRTRTGSQGLSGPVRALYSTTVSLSLGCPWPLLFMAMTRYVIWVARGWFWRRMRELMAVTSNVLQPIEKLRLL